MQGLTCRENFRTSASPLHRTRNSYETTIRGKIVPELLPREKTFSIDRENPRTSAPHLHKIRNPYETTTRLATTTTTSSRRVGP